MSSWSPPAYLKSNGVTKGTTRGTLARDAAGAFRYTDFATWWGSGLAAYAARGVRPDYISIQNEPDFFNTGWETCLLDASEGATNAGYGPALDAVFTRIQASDLEMKPQIIGPEISGTRRITNYLAGMNSVQIGAIAHHLYNGGGTGTNPDPSTFGTAMTAVATAASPLQKPLFMTEYSPGQPAMLETAGLIHQALTVEGVSAYFYWELFWAAPTNGIPTALVTLDNPGALTSARGYTINDMYYAVKHFAKWTDPGHVRIDAASSNPVVLATAFVAPDASSITAILINDDQAAPHGVIVDAGGFAFSTATVFRSSGSTERAAEVSFDSGMALTMPPAAIATVILAR
jgi:glucuronoarabinoxylan endo-1,4-beta-xylanase